MTRILLLFGWPAIVTTTLVGLLAGRLGGRWLHGALSLRGIPSVLPCDVCDRLVPVDIAHNGHQPGCGIDEREQCRCDLLLCPSCCACDVVAEVHRV